MGKNILSLLTGQKVTGLYVSQVTVDLVVLKATFQGPKLLKFAQTPIYLKEESGKEEIMPEQAEGVQMGKSIADEIQKSKKKTRDDYIVEAIQRLLKENNIKPGNVVSAVSSEDSMVRYFQMPKIPKQEWKSAINFEAKRYIPFRMEDVASDFQVIQKKGTDNTMDVVFTAIKQGTIERYVSMLERAKLRPVILEPAPFSLIRAFYAAGQINNKVNTAIVNIDSRAANINILRNGVPYIIRDIPLEEETTESKSLEPIFEKILGEIKLSFDFFEKQFPSESIDKILIYSHVPLENWHELVGKELQVQVEVGDPLRGIKAKKDIVPPKLAICFGLALRGISESFIDVNLYKEKLLTYKRKSLFLKTVFIEASAAVLLLIIIKVLTMKSIIPLSDELNKTLMERPKLNIGIKGESMDRLERVKQDMESRKNVLRNIISERTFFTSKMMDLVARTPNNIWLTGISFQEKVNKKNPLKIFRELTLEGYCVISGKTSETDAINNFQMNLKEGGIVNEGMSKADIISVEKTEINGEKVASFKIVFSGQ